MDIGTTANKVVALDANADLNVLNSLIVDYTSGNNGIIEFNSDTTGTNIIINLPIK